MGHQRFFWIIGKIVQALFIIVLSNLFYEIIAQTSFTYYFAFEPSELLQEK